VEKGERAGGMGKTPFFFLPSLPIQNRGGRGGLHPAVGAGSPGVGGGRGKGENGGGTEGISTPCSPWTGIACGGGSTASGGGPLWWLVVGVLGGLGGREVRLGGARRGGEPRRPFYRRGEVSSGEDFFELEELRWPAMAVEISWR
jgi:hypothetical protein